MCPMQNRTHQKGVSTLGLLGMLAGLGALFYFAFGHKTVTVPDGEGGTVEVQQGQAKDHVVKKVCQSDCNSAFRTCKASATDDAEKTACADEDDACLTACEGGEE